MSGRRLLVSLREVINSERILKCRSMIKADIDFWEEHLETEVEELEISINEAFDVRADYIMEAVLDDSATEVAITVSDYVARKLLKRSKCDNCKLALTPLLDNDSYLKTLSRGGLVTPSRYLADFVCNSFAILDYLKHDIIAFEIPVTKAATYTLKRYGRVLNFTCETHRDWGFKFATKIFVNIFFNNKQKQAKDSVRKEAVSTFQTRSKK